MRRIEKAELDAKLIAEKYILTFTGRASPQDALDVFEDLGVRLHGFETLTNQEFVVLHNFWVGILNMMGILTEKNLHGIVDDLLRKAETPMTDERKGGEETDARRG